MPGEGVHLPAHPSPSLLNEESSSPFFSSFLLSLILLVGRHASERGGARVAVVGLGEPEDRADTGVGGEEWVGIGFILI